MFVSIFCGTSNSAEASRGRRPPNFEARISARVFHLTSRYTQSLFEPEDEGFRSRLPKEICKMYLPFKGASRRARQGRALWKSGSMKGTQSSQGQLSWSIPGAASHRSLAPQTQAPAAPHRCHSEREDQCRGAGSYLQHKLWLHSDTEHEGTSKS